MINYWKYKLISIIWRLLDYITPKQSDKWAFATHPISNRFTENQRAVFEYVKKDIHIKKIIFYRDTDCDMDIEEAVNYEIVKQGTFRAFYLLLLCKVIFVSNSISMDFSIRFGQKQFILIKVNLKKHVVVNLWHGIAIKRLFYAANDKTRKHTDRVPFRRYERKYYAGLIASSEIDGLIMAAMFYPLSYLQIWTTGLPRNDFLLLDFDKLPDYIKRSILSIRKIKKDKRLIVYAPTYRQTEVSKNAYYYQFTDEEVDILRNILIKHNAILGYRPHYFKNSKSYFNLDKYIDNQYIYDISQSNIPEFSAIARECDILISDYSSVCLETMYLNKLNMSFAYDIDNYMNEQEGLIYNLSVVFSKHIYTNFISLLNALEDKLSTMDTIEAEALHNKQIFFNYCDCNNSERVVCKLKELLIKENNQ